ncbi:MAG: hypothetical protein K0R50_389 [Eubacterium sp.]|jgi:phage baseplate assembly protein gpV|nr:hypothetical protein [Eubacterium sp.]
MDYENILENLVRIGTVTNINITNRKARVLYQDKDNMMSGWLSVIQYPGIVDVKNKGKHLHTISEGEQIIVDCKHDHDAVVAYWMPAVNDTVLVLCLPVFNGDGFILGVI